MTMNNHIIKILFAKNRNEAKNIRDKPPKQFIADNRENNNNFNAQKFIEQNWKGTNSGITF